MKLTLDALEVLDAIATKGSFAAAAAALYRVPSTVTYTVQKLEEDLGFVIFRREGRRSVLTPAGQVLLEQGRELLQAANAMVDAAHQVNSGWEPNINIALDTVWDIDTFYPILKAFHGLNSGVTVNLTEEVMGGSLEAITDGRADLVIGGPPPVMNISGVKFQPLLDSEWLFVVAKDHALREKGFPLTEEDIKPYASVVISDSSRHSPIKAHRAFDKQTVVRVANMQQKIAAQIQGVGVGFLPRHKIQAHLNSGELIELAIDKKAPETTQYLSWRTNNKGKALRWFIKHILESTQR
ncbi:MAG: LysR family transcriptional regulator [Pseudomonadales bacterium]|nr:LysR family transcriptional regulator [Pseudomonadales bacterium]